MLKKYIYEIDRLIKQILKQENLGRFALFGIGELGRNFLKKTSLKDLIVESLYDNDLLKRGQIVDNTYRITLPPEILSSDILLLITSYCDRDIAEQLEKRGVRTWCSLPYLLKLVETSAKLNNPGIKACMIESSSFCNAKCAFCKNPTLRRKKQHMNRDIFEKIISRLKDEGYKPDRFSLHLLGEPLLDPEIFYKVKRLKEEFPDSEVGYASNVNYMTPKMADQILTSGQDYLTISINAIDREEYRNIMGLDYDITINNIAFLLEEKQKRKSNLEITMSIVASEEEKEKVDEFCRKWEKRQEKIFVRVMHKGKWLESKKDSYGNSEEGLLRKCAQGGIFCNMLLKELTVFSNGDYALCCFDSEGVLKMGNVMDTSIGELYGNVERKCLIYELLDGSASMKMCENCSFVS